MSSVSAINTITQEQFLKLLITQLQNQNPLEPITDQQFISQLTAFSTLQGIQSLNVSFEQMLRLQQLMGGASLIGRTVTYERPAGGPPSTGSVSGINVQNGQVILLIGTERVPLEQIRSIF